MAASTDLKKTSFKEAFPDFKHLHYKSVEERLEKIGGVEGLVAKLDPEKNFLDGNSIPLEIYTRGYEQSVSFLRALGWPAINTRLLLVEKLDQQKTENS